MALDFFRKIEAVLSGRQRQRLTSYDEMIVNIADGSGPHHEAVADMLESVGKNADDLAKDVQLILDRRAWKTEAETEAEWARKISETDRQSEAERARYAAECEANRQKHVDTIELLSEQSREAHAKLDSARTARNRLLESDPRFGNLLELQSKAAKPIQAIQGPLNRARAAAQAGVDSLRSQLRQTKREDLIAELNADLKTAESRLRQIDCEIAANQRQADAAKVEHDGLQKEMLQAV